MTPTLRSTLVPVGLTCALMAVVVAGVAWWNRHPAVNQAQARAVQPVIDAYMHDHPDQFGFGDVMNAGLTPELFCDATIIEIRPDGPRSRAGMMTFCGEYARRGNTLIETSIGYDIAIAELMTSGPGLHYRVLSLQTDPTDGYDPVWVHENFSRLAAQWILSTDPPTAPDPIAQARQAFGFPPGTLAVQE